MLAKDEAHLNDCKDEDTQQMDDRADKSTLRVDASAPFNCKLVRHSSIQINCVEQRCTRLVLLTHYKIKTNSLM